MERRRHLVAPILKMHHYSKPAYLCLDLARTLIEVTRFTQHCNDFTG